MSAERWKDDEALLESLRKGAPGAVDELLRLYQGKIFNLAMSILKNESDAEEAAQDVFMTVIRKVETFQGNSAFYSWIYRICVNTCLMRLRGKRRNETVSIEEFMPVFTDEGMHASPMDDWSKEVERDALNEELGRMIRKFTEELSEKYRVVFVLSDVEGLSNEEAAGLVDTSSLLPLEAYWKESGRGIILTSAHIGNLEGVARGIARHGYSILDAASGTPVGTVTSGTVGPTVGKNIGMGYLPPSHAEPGTRIVIDCRGKPAQAQVVKGPFYRRQAN